MAIRLLLADDHKIIRKGLRAILESQAEFEVIGETENGRETVQKVGEVSPDVVLMDVTMPDLNGIEATRQILRESPKVKVLALSMHDHEQFVRGMLLAGASGYLLKDCSVDELTTAIRTVTQGGAYLSPGLTSLVIEKYVSHVRNEEGSLPSALTHREKEVLQLVAEGKTSREIGSRLHISVKTVDTHRRQIMTKLGVGSVAELTKYAIRTGLTSIDP